MEGEAADYPAKKITYIIPFNPGGQSDITAQFQRKPLKEALGVDMTAGIIVGALPGLTATMAIALLVPFTFGVAPVRSLVLLGALLLQGMRPGLELFTAHGAVTYTFILSLILANIAMLPLCLVLGKGISRIITKIPVSVLAPFIFFLSAIGAYVINNNVFDVYLMLFFGLISWVGKKVNFHPGPIVLGLILGSICVQGLVQSILMAVLITPESAEGKKLRILRNILIGLTLNVQFPTGRLKLI